MEWSVLAMVKISFLGKAPRDEDIEEIEELLRGKESIDNFSVRVKEISFFIWGHKAPDYAVLEEIKAELNRRNYPDYVIAAQEFVKTEKEYYYAANARLS